MMARLLVLSDLHLNFKPLETTLEGGGRIDDRADVVVLAGDIDEGLRGLRWARQAFPDKPIVYVAGNHEFYGRHWGGHIRDMRQAALKLGIHFLEQEEVELYGVRFLGCSLWTDFALQGEAHRSEAMRLSQAAMNDYQLIKISQSREMYWEHSGLLTPAMTLRRHRESVAWLSRMLDIESNLKTVVVTHHAPHLGSVPLRYLDHPLTPTYASDLSRLMAKPKLWIHGHIHDSADYQVGGTRVVANPRGYSHRDGSSENPAFRADFILQLDICK